METIENANYQISINISDDGFGIYPDTISIIFNVNLSCRQAISLYNHRFIWADYYDVYNNTYVYILPYRDKVEACINDMIEYIDKCIIQTAEEKALVC